MFIFLFCSTIWNEVIFWNKKWPCPAASLLYPPPTPLNLKHPAQFDKHLPLLKYYLKLSFLYFLYRGCTLQYILNATPPHPFWKELTLFFYATPPSSKLRFSVFLWFEKFCHPHHKFSAPPKCYHGSTSAPPLLEILLQIFINFQENAYANDKFSPILRTFSPFKWSIWVFEP